MMVHIASIKGSGWSVCIGGFSGVKIDDVDNLLARVGEAVSPHVFQLFDADRVAGWEHLYFAAVNAVKAFEGGTAVSKSLAIEVLLYASCQDQITQAFSIIGVSPSVERVALLVTADEASEAERAFEQAAALFGLEDDSILEVDDKKLEALRHIYLVSDAELAAVGGAKASALTRLIIERGALLPIHR